MYSKKGRAFFGFLKSKINVFEIKQAGRNLPKVLQALLSLGDIFWCQMIFNTYEPNHVSSYTKGTVSLYITLKKDSNIIHV